MSRLHSFASKSSFDRLLSITRDRYIKLRKNPAARLMTGSVRDNKGMETVRMDKWLWAARFFKTRALAAKACDLGRIRSGSIDAKPARDVRIGDLLKIKTEGNDYEVEVLTLSEVRGPAAVAQTLYRETDESRQRREELAAAQKALRQLEGFPPAGRPSKRDRREINRFRGRA
jgi:ribosome-associated heat shock protein Hsp15